MAKGFYFYRGSKGDFIAKSPSGKVVLPHRCTPVTAEGAYEVEAEERERVIIARVIRGPLEPTHANGVPRAVAVGLRIHGYGVDEIFYADPQDIEEYKRRRQELALKREMEDAEILRRFRVREEKLKAVHVAYEQGEISGEEANRRLAAIVEEYR